MIPSEPLEHTSTYLESIIALDNWLQTPAGHYFIEREQAWLDRVVPDLFGFRAVQLGTRRVDGLRESRIPHKAYCAQALFGQVDACFEFEDLPFESQSIDLLVLPHVLEFSSDPHQLLREAERVLMPEGRLILTGFNPMSLWGLRHWVLKRRWPVWPEGCEPITLNRLKDWLKLLSIEPETGRFGGYRFPAFSDKNLSRFEFMEHAGDRWWPVCGGAYYLCAVKRVRGMRLVGPEFKNKNASMKQLKPAAQKVLQKTPTM